MPHHRALGLSLEALTIAVIDNRRPMLAMLRAMLAAIGAGRIDTYECPAEALALMDEARPDLVIAAATMTPLTGPELVRAMRQAGTGPLCFVPAVLSSSGAEPDLTEEAFAAGAHQVLILPIAASTLHRRLEWLLNDDRPYELHGDHYVVAGLADARAPSLPHPLHKVPFAAKARAAAG